MKNYKKPAEFIRLKPPPNAECEKVQAVIEFYLRAHCHEIVHGFFYDKILTGKKKKIAIKVEINRAKKRVKAIQDLLRQLRNQLVLKSPTLNFLILDYRSAELDNIKKMEKICDNMLLNVEALKKALVSISSKKRGPSLLPKEIAASILAGLKYLRRSNTNMNWYREYLGTSSVHEYQRMAAQNYIDRLYKTHNSPIAERKTSEDILKRYSPLNLVSRSDLPDSKKWSYDLERQYRKTYKSENIHDEKDRQLKFDERSLVISLYKILNETNLSAHFRQWEF